MSSTVSYPVKFPSSTSSPKAVFTCASVMANGRQMVLHSLALMVRKTRTLTPVASVGGVIEVSSSTTLLDTFILKVMASGLSGVASVCTNSMGEMVA